MQERVCKIAVPTVLKQCLIDRRASVSQSMKLLIYKESGYLHARKRKDISLNICLTKTSFFTSATLHKRLFSEPLLPQ